MINKIDRQLFQRYFHDLEVVDATFDLYLKPNEEDIAGAIPGDPENCAYARCAHRLYGATAALFFRTVSYVDLIDENAIRKVYRFRHDDGVYERIIHLDQTGQMEPDPIRIHAPKSGRTLDAMREYRRQAKLGTQKRKRRRNARIKGEYKPIHTALVDVRSGTGMVHFKRLRQNP